MTTTFSTTYAGFLALGMPKIQTCLWYNMRTGADGMRINFYWVDETGPRELQFIENNVKFILSPPSEAFAKGDGENKKAKLPGGQFTVKSSYGLLTKPRGAILTDAEVMTEGDKAMLSYYRVQVILCTLLAMDAVDYNDYYSDDQAAAYFPPPERFRVDRSIVPEGKRAPLQRQMSTTANCMRFSTVTKGNVCNAAIKSGDLDVIVKTVVAKCSYVQILASYKGKGSGDKVYFCKYDPPLDFRKVDTPNAKVASVYVPRATFDAELAKSTSTLKPTSMAEVAAIDIPVGTGKVPAYSLPLFRFYGLNNGAHGNVAYKPEVYIGGKQILRSVVAYVMHRDFAAGGGGQDDIVADACEGFGAPVIAEVSEFN